MTLIELVMVVAIVSILSLLGAPALGTMIAKNRLATAMSSFVTDMQFARSEASKRGVSVGICASTDGAGCAASDNWSTGRIVFVDADRNSEFTSGETILRKTEKLKAGDQMIANNSLQLIMFNREGFATNISSETTMTVKNPKDTSLTRCLVLSRAARTTFALPGAGDCAA